MPEFFTIDPQFFLDHPNYANLLDPGDVAKQSNRLYLCVKVNVGGYDAFIPLRRNLGAAERPFGKIGYPVPSQNKPNAGLDYRYMLIISDAKYLHKQNAVYIPSQQLDAINNNFATIVSEATIYLRKYVKAARKNRATKEPLFRVSSLVNFNDVLL